MKRFYVLAVVAAMFALCEVKEILTECPIVSNDWWTIHIPHETNPHWFYKCNAGRKVLFKCPLNKDPPFELCYNPELQVCDWPWNVTACGGGPPQPPQSTQPTQPTQSTQPTQPTQTTQPTQPTQPTQSTQPTQPTQSTQPTQPTQSTQPTQPTQTTQPTQPTQPTQSTQPTQPTQPTRPTDPNPWGCPVNGKLPYEKNCKMYYDYDGIPVCCLQNMVFNPKFCVCDIPGNVPTCVPTAANYEECSH